MSEWLEFSDLIEKAQQLLELGLTNQAKELLLDYAGIYATQWEFNYLLARVHSDNAEHQQALEYLLRCYKDNKSNPEILVSLFYTYVQLEKYQKGVRYLLRAAKHHPFDEQIQATLIWHYTEIGDYPSAIAVYERLQKKGIDTAEASRNVAIAHQRMGNFAEAVRCFERALEMNPNFEEARDLLADHYLFTGQPQKAIGLYQAYLQKSPKNIRTLSRLVYCLSQSEQVEEAEKIAQSIIEHYPNSTIGYIDLAYLYLNAKRYDQAVIYADKALDISPIDAEAYRIKAVAHSEQGQNTQARKVFEHALSLDPKNPELMRDYYSFMHAIGNIAIMLSTVEKVIQQQYPDCVEDFWYLATYYKQRGESSRAFHYLHKAYKCMPGDKELLPPMIEILLERGHKNLSIPFLVKYVKSHGWNDTMSYFSKDKRLQDKWMQEGMRFLLFSGNEVTEFRRLIFAHQLSIFIFWAIIVLTPVIFILFYILLHFVFEHTHVSIVAAGISLFWCLAALILRKKLLNRFREKFRRMT